MISRLATGRRATAGDSLIGADGSRGKWEPTPWNAPRPSEPGRRRPPSTPTTPPPRPPKPRPQPLDPDRPTVLGFALAPAVTGIVAVPLVFLRPLNTSAGLPFALILLCVIQLVAYLITRRSEVAILGRSWLVALLMTVGLLPLLALQADLLRQPYAGKYPGESTPILIATAIVLLFLIVVAIWCLIAHAATAELASLAFIPLALLVPAALGVQSTIEQREALEIIAESAIFAAGATVLAWSMPRGARLFVPPIAFLIQFVVLWTAGRGPTFPETSGRLVDLLYWLTLLITGALTVLLPIAASWLHHTIARVDEEDQRRRRATRERIEGNRGA